jgi:uncharacterized protein DUF4245
VEGVGEDGDVTNSDRRAAPAEAHDDGDLVPDEGREEPSDEREDEAGAGDDDTREEDTREEDTDEPDRPDYGATRRTGRTARDMALSLVVLLVPVAIIMGLVWLRGGNDVVTVDPTPVISTAQAAKAFPVSVPRGLPEDWRTVSATFTGNPPGAVLRLGYVAPSGGGLQLIESNAPVDGLLIRELGDQTRPLGTVSAGRREWNAYQVRGDQRALVLTGTGRTVIVIGAADLSELQALAGALA